MIKQEKQMKLYLVRHAEPKQESEDPKRPLSEKGRIDSRRVAAYVAKHLKIQVKCILHSGKLRAQQTAEVLSEHLTPPDGLKEVDGLKPLDEPSIWASRIAETQEDTMLVGHLPHLSKLAAYLISHDESQKIVEFQASTIVCLGRDTSGNWSIQWIINPDDV